MEADPLNAGARRAVLRTAGARGSPKGDSGLRPLYLKQIIATGSHYL